MTRELIQLPNKDLWRGYVYEEAITPENVAKELKAEISDPMNRAMAAIHANAKGAVELSCNWCGLQGNDAWMREHLKTRHKTVVFGLPDAAIAVADASNARAELAKAKAEKE